MKQRMPSISDYLRENFTPDVQYNQQTANTDITKLASEVDNLQKNLQTMMHDGKSDYNTVNTAILNYLNKQTQLSYLKLASQIQIPAANKPNPSETPIVNTNQQQTNPV